jgi:hypothetical protein
MAVAVMVLPDVQEVGIIEVKVVLRQQHCANMSTSNIDLAIWTMRRWSWAWSPHPTGEGNTTIASTTVNRYAT